MFLVVLVDDGEGVEDGGGLGFVEVVEVEVEGVELAAEMSASGFVPGEGGGVVAEVFGEGAHVLGRVGQFKDALANPRADVPPFEWGFVGGRGEDGELFDNEEVEVLTVDFLTGDVIEGERCEVRN